MFQDDSSESFYRSGTLYPYQRHQSTPNTLQDGLGDGLVLWIARRPTQTSTMAGDGAESRSRDPARRIGTGRQHAVGVADEQLSRSSVTSTRVHCVRSQASAARHAVKTSNRQTPPEQAAAHFGAFCCEMGNQLYLKPDMGFLSKDRRDARRPGV